MVRTKGMVRNVFLLGVFLALIITAVWLLLRGSDWESRAVVGSRPDADSLRFVPREDTSPNRDQETVSGVLSIFNEELVFASSEFRLTAQEFEIEAQDFNLSLLGNPALRVENTYPTLNLRTAGTYVREGELLRLQITEVTPVLQVRMEDEVRSLPTAEQTRILTNLQSSGVRIPEADSTNPYLVTVRRVQEDPVEVRSVEDTTTRFVFVEN